MFSSQSNEIIMYKVSSIQDLDYHDDDSDNHSTLDTDKFQNQEQNPLQFNLKYSNNNGDINSIKQCQIKNYFQGENNNNEVEEEEDQEQAALYTGQYFYEQQGNNNNKNNDKSIINSSRPQFDFCFNNQLEIEQNEQSINQNLLTCQEQANHFAKQQEFKREVEIALESFEQSENIFAIFQTYREDSIQQQQGYDQNNKSNDIPNHSNNHYTQVNDNIAQQKKTIQQNLPIQKIINKERKKPAKKEKEQNTFQQNKCEETKNLFILIVPYFQKCLVNKYPSIKFLEAYSVTKNKSLTYFNNILYQQLSQLNDEEQEQFKQICLTIIEKELTRYARNQNTYQTQFMIEKYLPGFRLIVQHPNMYHSIKVANDQANRHITKYI